MGLQGKVLAAAKGSPSYFKLCSLTPGERERAESEQEGRGRGCRALAVAYNDDMKDIEEMEECSPTRRARRLRPARNVAESIRACGRGRAS
ncbi:MAG: hypothetical protein ACLUEQ_09360 [Cloacibacillus evryensis]